MNRYIKAAAAFGAVVTLGACATSSGPPAAASTGVSTTPLGLTDQWAATVNPVGGTGISGTAAAVGAANQTNATVKLGGAMAGVTHPWHIHLGQCGDNGKIVGPPDSYPPLTVATDGTASATATVPTGLNSTTRYYVNIHKSPGEMGVIVACGNLTRAGR
ncbi:MAG: CHRD domain-containing protein [Gemmatimonadaceae bacterium]